MSVVIRCPACLSLLPSGARRCAACGLDFVPAAQRRARAILLTAACALAAGAGAWLLRGHSQSRAETPVASSPPQIAAPPAPPAAFDEPHPVAGSKSEPSPSASLVQPPAVDEAALDRLASSLLRIETRDASGNPLRAASAFRPDATRDVVLSFRALNGAESLVRSAGDASGEASTTELLAMDGTELARVAGLAPETAAVAAIAPAASIGVGSGAWSLSDDASHRFAPTGTVVGIDARAGEVELAPSAPCDQRWVADAAGRLLGLARLDGDGRTRLRLLEPALARMQSARPMRLQQVDANWFDRDPAARRERASWYAAAEQYATALANYLVAIDLEPRLQSEVAAPASACAQLALRDARLRDRVGDLVPLLERASEVLDKEPAVLHACGLALLDQGDPERALPFLLDAASLAGANDSDYVEAVRVGYLHAGEAARALGRAEDAIRLLEEGLLRFREDPLLLKSLGFAYYELGDRERARIVLEKVASLNADDARMLEPLLARLQPEKPAASDAPAVEIRFDREDGAIRTTARFGERTDAKVIIDTGATISAISEGLADKLRIDRNRAERRVQIMTANGKIEAPVVTLASLDVQGARVTNVDAVVLPLQEDGGCEALVGLNFLEHFALSLDARRGVLRLTEKR
jgi:clan AA aspartic protease (TIGR02281 family)